MTSLGFVVSKVYVVYKDDGTVIFIDNQPSLDHKNFEIHYDLVRDLYDHRVNLSKYKVDYFYNLSKGIIDEVPDEVEIKTELPYIVPLTTSFNNEITLEHCTSLESWVMYVRPDIADKLELIDRMVFYITEKDDPHFLLGTVDLNIKITNLTDNKLVFPFTHSIEKNLDKFSLVVANRQFKSYGIRKEDAAEV